MCGVGSEKIFENDRIIMWNFVLPPGEQTPVHTHENAYMWYVVVGGSVQLFDEGGKDLGSFEVPTGSIFSLKLEGEILEFTSELGKGIKVPARHSAKNVGSTAYREVLVEFK